MKIIVNNLAVEYTDEGKGPVMLFLHGWGNDLHSFDAVATAFSGSYRIIQLDFPGFGGSELPEDAWSVGAYAHFVAEFCKKLQVEPSLLAGHSFGGRVIIKGVAEKVLRPDRIVLIASAGLAIHRTVRVRLFWLAAKLGKIAMRLLPPRTREQMRKRLYGAAGTTDYLHVPLKLKQTFLNVTQEDLSNAASRIALPTLCIWGSNDIATPISDGKRIHGLISGSRFEVIEGAGHFVHQERPREVTDLIRQFLL